MRETSGSLPYSAEPMHLVPGLTFPLSSSWPLNWKTLWSTSHIHVVTKLLSISLLGSYQKRNSEGCCQGFGVRRGEC